MTLSAPPGNSWRAVVITGASGAIGTATAHRLSAAGYVTILHYGSQRAKTEKLARLLCSGGGQSHAIGADLAVTSGVERFVEQLDLYLREHSHVRVWGLVNNAALMLGPSFQNATHEAFNQYFALNVRAPFFLSQTISERMTSGGSIVNISSVGAHFSSPGDIIYAMSKAALESLTVNAAEALAARGIRINSVIPGFTENGHALLQQPGIRDYVSSFAVLGGIADPGSVADAVAFLLSEQSSRTTGVALDVSGGSALGARRPVAPGISLRDVLNEKVEP